MVGGLAMRRTRTSETAILVLEGEQGRRIYERLLNAPKKKYDAKKAIKEARKNLRKQGFRI